MLSSQISNSTTCLQLYDETATLGEHDIMPCYSNSHLWQPFIRARVISDTEDTFVEYSSINLGCCRLMFSPTYLASVTVVDHLFLEKTSKWNKQPKP